jgi:hypothetical protein
MLEASLDLLRMLRQIADEYAGAFESTGFCRLFTMIQQFTANLYRFEIASLHRQ